MAPSPKPPRTHHPPNLSEDLFIFLLPTSYIDHLIQNAEISTSSTNAFCLLLMFIPSSSSSSSLVQLLPNIEDDTEYHAYWERHDHDHLVDFLLLIGFAFVANITGKQLPPHFDLITKFFKRFNSFHDGRGDEKILAWEKRYICREKWWYILQMMRAFGSLERNYYQSMQ